MGALSAKVMTKNPLPHGDTHGAAGLVDAMQVRRSVTVDDFYAYLPQHRYLFVPTREMWPAASVNAAIPLCSLPDGSSQRPADWLDRNRSVEQLTWAPGENALIAGRLIDEGGWIEKAGCHTFNLYRPPVQIDGDWQLASKWLDHVRYVYPGYSRHIIHWLAHRVQRPGEKINHALVLGGAQGIGKDTILEPVRYAVGECNFVDVSPANMLGRFNGFAKSVALRVSEVRDLGDTDRYAFYEHMKPYIAAPPNAIRCDEKNLREHYVPNVTGVIFTTNHKSGGIYLPADDRRHFVAWSERGRQDFNDAYWKAIWDWYGAGGIGHVAAYLRHVDLKYFNPKAPPRQTSAFMDIVDAGRAPEDAELADAIDRLGNPMVVTREELIDKADESLAEWLMDRRSRRQIPHRLESCGYRAVRNADVQDGLYVIQGRRQAVYGKANASESERVAAALAKARHG
jgi:hypothetical protein